MLIKRLISTSGPNAQASTCLDPRVLDKMMPYMTHTYGNPHSRTHSYGWDANNAVEKARCQIADLIKADPKEIIFTSGATESNNIAIKGISRFYKSTKDHIITTQTEHKCILDSCRAMEQEGVRVTYLGVNKAGSTDSNSSNAVRNTAPSGLISLEDLRNNITDKTGLVSVMHVNNEIGVIQPLREIGEICKERNVFFHSDAAQSIGKIPINVHDMNLSLLSISGHKIYGPKGIGALFVRRRPRVRVEAIQTGGGQERGIRSGTLPTHLIVGLGEACEIANHEMERDYARIKALSERLIGGLKSKIPSIFRNGDDDTTYPGCVNISFAYVEGESILMALKSIALSSGSACTSASLEPSYVLRALGTTEDIAHSSLRFGIGRFTTEKEIDYTVDQCITHINRLRDMSPLWEMVQEGVDLTTIQWAAPH